MHAKLLAPCLAILLAARAAATNVGPSTIEQPVNLGEQSDPSRIPLGAVAVESNYHYGRGPVITAPRPCLQGGMPWKSGVELNQNLASVFGIEVDNHDLPDSPAVIRLRDSPKPAYSPYTKEQVLAATIHCLLRSNRGTPERPMVLEITADAPEDKPLTEKYAGKYINASERPEVQVVEPTPVPGTRLESDARGITWVVFGEGKKNLDPPAMIPFRIGGDDDSESPSWDLLPVWSFGDLSGAELLGQPYPVFYDCFKPGTGMGTETHAIFAERPAGSIDGLEVREEETGTVANFRFPHARTLSLSATVLAMVASVQPTEQHPLTVRLEASLTSRDPWIDAFRNCPGWEVKAHENSNLTDRKVLACVFVLDPETAAMKRGAVPDASLERAPGGKLYIAVPPPTPEEQKSLEAYRRRFTERWKAGEFEPKEDHLDVPGKGVPVIREFWMAGYREAVASYQAGPVSQAGPPERERTTGWDAEAAKSWLEGWTAGIRNGSLFAAKVMDEVKPHAPTPDGE
jgi:hypothetical protein